MSGLQFRAARLGMRAPMDGDPDMHSGEIEDQFLTQKRILKKMEYHILSVVCVCLCFKRLGL